MKKPILKNLAISAAALLLSANTFAFIYPYNPDPTPPSTTNPTTPDNPTTPSNPENAETTRGSDPTTSTLEASKGPYSVRTVGVSSSVQGFGGGTIHYPEGTSGKMGAIAVVPGFVSNESSIKWWGPRLASWGFVVITINTNSGYDQPDSRAQQLSSALDYVIGQSNGNSPISGMVDSNRLGVIGWSMGGGGTLKLSTQRALKAIIPQAPWYSGSSAFKAVKTPTFFIACQNDTIAPVAQHAAPFYDAIPSSTPKAFLNIRGGDHFCGNSGNANANILGKYGVSWMKRFIDGDNRYSQFLCGPNHTANQNITEYRDTCNY